MKPFEITKKIYSVGEVSELLGVSDTAIRKWLKDRTIRAVRMKRRWFIPAEEIAGMFERAGLEIASSHENLVIVVGGTKGGTGKTTLAINFAALHAANGHEVLLVDADKQGSAALWAGWRDDENIEPRVPCVQKRGGGLDREIKQFAAKYDTVIVDAGGYDNNELRQAMSVAQGLLVPIRPSQFDVAELARMIPLIVECERLNPDLSCTVVINSAHPHPNSSEIRETRRSLMQIPQISSEEHPHIWLLDHEIRDRIAFRGAIPVGRAVFEVTPVDTKAVEELQSVYKEVLDRVSVEDTTSHVAFS
ncbi:AAA family ATPase [Thermodesulfobacteriota bacterium]